MPEFGTKIFVNGRWITPEQERDPLLKMFEEKTHQSAPPPPPLPKLGILTQTVVESPLTHWTLPIANEAVHYSDIAFIGDNSIRIRRLDRTGSLTLLWETHNIRPRIRNAISLRQQHWLVLALEDGDILFVTRLDQLCQGIPPLFSWYRPQDERFAARFPGTDIATDPNSQYAAVACSESLILVVAVNNDVRQATLNPHHQSECVRSEHVISIQGVILKLDFMRPSASDSDLVVLVVVAFYEGEIRIHSYQWQAGSSLEQIHRCHSHKGFQLPASHQQQIPLLLIPLSSSRPATCLLVYETSIVLVGGLLGTGFTATSSLLPDAPSPSSYRAANRPLWVSWYEEPELKTYTLVREDGTLLSLVEQDLPDVMAAIKRFPGAVDKVTAILLDNSAQRYPSSVYLMTEPPSGLRGVYKLADDGSVSRTPLSTISNWAPMNDFSAVPLEAPTEPSTSQLPARIYGCSGHGSGGFATELLRHVEAFVRFTVSNAAFKNMDGLWALPHSTNKPCCSCGKLTCDPEILVSFPDRSMLFRILADQDELFSIPQKETWLDLSSRTFVASFETSPFFQVTANHIKVSKGNIATAPTTDKRQDHISSPSRDTHLGEVVLKGASSGLGFCLSAFSQAKGHRLRLYRIRTSLSGPLQPPTLLHSLKWLPLKPACLAMTQIEGQYLVAVGSVGPLESLDGAESSACSRVGTFYFMGEGGVHRVRFGNGNRDTGDCVSVGLLTSTDNRVLVLSGQPDGLFSGWVESPTCVTPESLKKQHSFHRWLGNSEVVISTVPSKRNIAIISCGSFAYRFSYNWATQVSHLTKVSLPAETVPAQITPKTLVSTYGKGFLIGSASKILGVDLGEEVIGFFETHPGLSPNSTEFLSGPANKMLISRNYGGLIVAGTRIKEGHVYGPALLAYDFEGTTIEGVLSWRSTTKDAKKTPEKTTCMIDLVTLENEQPVVLNLVGTSRGVLTLSARNIGGLDEPRFRYVASSKFDGPIYALVSHPWNPDHVYACIGEELRLLKIRGDPAGPVSFEFSTLLTHRLPSHGVSLSFTFHLDGPRNKLSVLTAQHSVITFSAIGDQVRETFADTESRNGLDMVEIWDKATNSEIVLLTDSDCTVTGLYAPRGGLGDGSPKTYKKLFEAELPVSIRKLKIIDSWPLHDLQTPSLLSGNRDVVALHPGDNFTDPKLLGIALDGSVRRFTILREPLWQLLALMQHYALQVPEMRPIASSVAMSEADYEQDKLLCHSERPSDPAKMSLHIDGELLTQWLRLRNLKAFLDEAPLAPSFGVSIKMEMFLAVVYQYRPDWVSPFLGDDPTDGLWGLKWEPSDIERLVERVYWLLEDLLRPVL